MPLTALLPHPLGHLWVQNGMWEQLEPRCPLQAGLSPGACGDDGPAPGPHLGAAVPRPWPGWPRCPHRLASAPRQPGTPLALPKCLIKGICGAAEPGCNLALTVRLFQRLGQPAKVAGCLITGRRAAGRRPERGGATNEGDAFLCALGTRAALSQRPCHSGLVTASQPTAWLRSDRSLAWHCPRARPPPFWRWRLPRRTGTARLASFPLLPCCVAPWLPSLGTAVTVPGWPELSWDTPEFPGGMC